MGTEHFIAYYFAPALAGIKPANIAAYSKSKNPCILSELEKLNNTLNKNDIYGFINHRDEKCLLTGEWKVYADAENAKKLFCRYTACRRAVVKRLNAGKTLKELFCAV